LRRGLGRGCFQRLALERNQRIHGSGIGRDAERRDDCERRQENQGHSRGKALGDPGAEGSLR
jgi:hypothetical protein